MTRVITSKALLLQEHPIQMLVHHPHREDDVVLSTPAVSKDTIMHKYWNCCTPPLQRKGGSTRVLAEGGSTARGVQLVVSEAKNAHFKLQNLAFFAAALRAALRGGSTRGVHPPSSGGGFNNSGASTIPVFMVGALYALRPALKVGWNTSSLTS